MCGCSNVPGTAFGFPTHNLGCRCFHGESVFYLRDSLLKSLAHCSISGITSRSGDVQCCTKEPRRAPEQSYFVALHFSSCAKLVCEVSVRLLEVLVLYLIDVEQKVSGFLVIILLPTRPLIANALGEPTIYYVIALGCTSLLTNCIISVLIALRIRRHQRVLRNNLGRAHGKVYTRIIVICVESCTLIAFTEAIQVVLATITESAFPWPLYVTFSLLPHICVSNLF